ncbi:hypothetical protein L1987_50310 [Smallanthus sonchifolius]|uniref:Uncharacterized protein n=1 Tax=Smallanthus sonchifolius TaxID=185202 RepID=A0ACB9ELK4_9ASTR|nr:hypothetical protein L1987_50310 [Smallanthus sonchifolius]
MMMNPIVVVNTNFLAPNPVDLVIVKKLMSLSNGSFTVTNVNDNVMFKIKGKVMSLHERRVLLDVAGNPILSAKRSSNLQLKTSLDVLLAHNVEENVYDFKVKGSWFERSCTVCAGDGTTIIAQVK